MNKYFTTFKRTLILITLLFLSLLIYLAPFYSYAKTLKEAKYYPQTLTVNGVKRQYYVYLPIGLDLKKKSPAVITFHGFESDANGIKWLIQPEKLANKHKYILIFPNAINKSWNVGKGMGSINTKVDDKAFLAKLLAVLPEKHPINKKKIYSMGFSNGAQMAALAYCFFGDKVAAVGLIAHSMNIEDCQPKYKTPVTIIQNTADKYVPYYGGGKYQLRSFKDSVDYFVKANNVKSVVDKVVNLKTVTCQRYQNMEKTSKVIGCTLRDSGHTWPGARKFKPERFGLSNKEINATSFLFNFFKRHNSPAPARSSTEIASTPIFSTIKGKKSKPKQISPKSLTHKKIVFDKRTYAKGKSKNTFYLTRPTKKSDKKGSLVIVFGPKSYTARNMHSIIGGSYYANHYNFLYIYPQWNDGNHAVSKQFDELFLHQLKTQFPKYAHRIFVLGFSNGGRAAQDYYCNYSFMLTAVATANYAWMNNECTPATSRPVLVLQSKKDAVQPFKGGKDKGLLSFKQTIQQLTVDFNPMITKNQYIKGKDYRCNSWKDEAVKLTVVGCSIDWGGHNLAGSKFSFDKKLGPHMKHFEAPKIITGFFHNQKHIDFFTYHQR